MKEKLFRKAALQNLSVSDRLDTAVQVVGPASSLVVIAAAVSIGTAMVWALVGHVPTRVYGDGLLLQRGSIVDVTSMADGQVQRLAVAVGDRVNEDDVIAYIEQPELKKQQALLEAKVSELEGKYAEFARLDEKGRELKRAVFHQQRATVEFAVAETLKQLAFYEGKLKADEALLNQGLATPVAVAETRQRILDLSDAINQKHADGHTIEFNALETTRTLEVRKFELSLNVSETKRELEEVQKRIDMQSVVRAKAAGRIIEVKLTEGDAVTRGRSIATLEAARAAGDLVAEVYVPAQDGKRVAPGMLVRLAPSVIKPEEDGYLEGVVDTVSPFPVTEQAMLRGVRNDSVVTALLKGGPVYEVQVRVTADPSTPSGLRWSNGRGPATQLASGTPVHSLVTVRTRKPIELVIPALKRVLTDAPAAPEEG